MSPAEKQLQRWFSLTLTKPEPLEPKWIAGMPMSVYGAAPGIRSSALKFTTEKEARHNLLQADEPSYPLSLGSLLHMAVLEPDKFDSEGGIEKEFQLSPTKTLNSVGALKLFEANPDRLLYTEDMLEKARRMREAIFDNDFADELLRVVGRRELCGFAWDEEHQVNRKVRIDLLPEGDSMIDIKTTDSIAERDFWFSCAKFGYAESGAFYMDTAEMIDGIKRRNYFLIAVEGPKGPSQGPLDAPYDCDVFEINRMDPSLIARGRERYLEKMSRLTHAARQWEWPGQAQRRIDSDGLKFLQLCAEPPTFSGPKT